MISSYDIFVPRIITAFTLIYNSRLEHPFPSALAPMMPLNFWQNLISVQPSVPRVRPMISHSTLVIMEVIIISFFYSMYSKKPKGVVTYLFLIVGVSFRNL